MQINTELAQDLLKENDSSEENSVDTNGNRRGRVYEKKRRKMEMIREASEEARSRDLE